MEDGKYKHSAKDKAKFFKGVEKVMKEHPKLSLQQAFEKYKKSKK